MAAVTAIAIVVVISGVLVVREWIWLRRVERASGDPVELARILKRRRWRGLDE